MKKILLFLFTLLNFSKSHYFGDQIELEENEIDKEGWDSKQTNHRSETKEMATCTCDLTSLCDIYCCCDEDCSETYRKDWKEKSLCLDVHKKWVEDYKCKNGEETFAYNKEKAGINIKDYIFNIMCIRWDNSQDMVNYYLDFNEDTDRQGIEDLKKSWKNNFFGSSTRRLQEKAIKYGDSINLDGTDTKMVLYKADSNGICTNANTSFYFLIPFESSCYLEPELNLNNDNFSVNKSIIYGDGGFISEITYIVNYTSTNSIYSIDKIEAKVLKTNVDTKQKKFKVQWRNTVVNQTKNFPYGYLQGNPIKLSKKKESTDYFYNYGYYFHIYDLDGNCIKDAQNSYNPISILFKNNMFISCKYNKDESLSGYLIYQIYENILNENIKFYSAPNATENIKILNKTATNFKEADNNGKDIKINLIFLTTQKGKENSPYDIIQKVYIKMESKDSSSTDQRISLNVKFVDFSYSTIINSKENKITNAIPLPQSLLNKLSEKNDK